MNPVQMKGTTNITLGDVPIPKELIEFLNKAIPERCPDMEADDRHIWHYAGQRSLVRNLTAAFERQKAKMQVV